MVYDGTPLQSNYNICNMTGQDIRANVDREGRRFLDAVRYYGGEATMTEIRQRTGLSHEVADWRFRRLEDLGLIEIYYAEVGRGGREPPRVAELTGTARREIERGLLYDIDKSRNNDELNDLQSENRALREEIEEIRSMVNALTETLRQQDDRLSDIEHDITDVIYPWTEVAEDEIRSNRQACRCSN
jgi:DNA-binding Lrp family transcriptional regulator